MKGENGRPSVLVGMPRYGDVAAGAARGLYCPTKGAVDVWRVAEACNSLTPNAFNDLLALALDARDAGAVTHFAMIHADVEPVGPWVDELWDEMRTTGADVVSAVVPIKEDVDDPPTSTAVGDGADPWLVKRRIKVSERAALPETFGPDDVCGPGEVLLVNTGLWLADLRHPAWDAFSGFAIHTEIVRDGDGRRRGRCRPEDWELSRHLHRHGAVVRATWRVPLVHRGAAGWGNR